MSVVRINNFAAKAGQAERLGKFLLSVVPLIEQAEGCQSCMLLHSHDDENVFVMIEVWASVDAHRASVKQIPPEKILAAMTMLAAPPSGEYYSKKM